MAYKPYTLRQAIKNRIERIKALPAKEARELSVKTIKQFKRMISGTTVGPEKVELAWDDWGYIQGMSIGNRLDMQDYIYALEGKVSARQKASSLINAAGMRQLGLIKT